jgi:hypothetical protein
MLGVARRARAITVVALLFPGCLGFGDLMGGGADGGSAMTDASLGDVVIGNDGNLGITDGGTGDASAFCAQHASATFCADFDESDAAQSGFTGSIASGGGFFSVDHVEFRSAPGSLLAGSFALDSGAQSYGDVQRTTAITPTTSATLDFDLFADQLPPLTSTIESLAIVFESPTRSALQLNLNTTNGNVGEEIVQLDGGKSFYPHYLAGAFPTGAWTHVTIALTFSPTREVSVTIGSAAPIVSPINSEFVTGTAQLNVGNAYAPGPSPGSTLHYDNIVFNVN